MSENDPGQGARLAGEVYRDPKVREGLRKCAMLSVTGRLSPLAEELADLIARGYPISGSDWAPTLVTSPQGLPFVKEVIDGEAFYNFRNEKLERYNYSWLVSERSVDLEDRESELIRLEEEDREREYKKNFAMRRIKEDSPIITPFEYDVEEMSTNFQLLSEALFRGFVRFEHHFIEILPLVGDVAGLSSEDLLSRLAEVIQFLVNEANYSFERNYPSGEIALRFPHSTYPFRDFNWRGCLESPIEGQMPGEGDLAITREILPADDTNNPFPSRVCAQTDSLLRASAAKELNGGVHAVSVADVLLDEVGAPVAVSLEDRIYDPARSIPFPLMVVGRTAIYPALTRNPDDEPEEINSLEVWSARFHRGFAGYTVTCYGDGGYMAYDIPPEQYQGPYSPTPRDRVGIKRSATQEEIRNHLRYVGRFSFINEGKIDYVAEYWREIILGHSDEDE